MADPVLAEMVHATGATESRHYAAVKPTIQAFRASWVKLAPYRDGPVNSRRVTVNDPAPMTAHIKSKAKELGAHMVGVCRLQPHMIDLGSEVAHEFVIACCVAGLADSQITFRPVSGWRHTMSERPSPLKSPAPPCCHGPGTLVAGSCVA